MRNALLRWQIEEYANKTPFNTDSGFGKKKPILQGLLEAVAFDGLRI